MKKIFKIFVILISTISLDVLGNSSEKNEKALNQLE
jgi:hypothetical protein